MTIEKWLNTIGRDKAVKLLGVDESCLSQWTTRHVLPRAKTMIKIHKLSHGKVSYREMVETAARKKN